MSELLFKAVHTGYDMKNRPVHICVNEDGTQYVYNPRTGFKSRSWPADSVDVQACFERQVSNSQTHAHYLEEEKEIPVAVAAPAAEETPAPTITEAPAAPATEESSAPTITETPAAPAAEESSAPTITEAPAAPAAEETAAPVKAAKNKSATKPKAAKTAPKKAAKKKSATAKK